VAMVHLRLTVGYWQPNFSFITALSSQSHHHPSCQPILFNRPLIRPTNLRHSHQLQHPHNHLLNSLNHFISHSPSSTNSSAYSTMATKERRAHFHENPVSDVRSFSSPASTVSSLSPSPGPSTPPPLPDVAFSSPSHSPSHAPISAFPSPPHPRVYTPSPIPQAHALPYIPPAPLTPSVYLHTSLAPPTLQYDVRYHHTQYNLQISPAVLAEPATSPPRQSLYLRVAGLPWKCSVRPDPTLSPGGAVVTVQDVLVCLYYYLRTQVKADEYNAMGKARKTEIFQTFERRVGHDPVQRGKGLRRVDFLGGHVMAQGLARAQSKEEVWEVVLR
jgi:hypothetical protein